MSGARRRSAPVGQCLAVGVQADSVVREYLYIDQLAERTPWTPDAIRTMIARGVFKLGVHYYKPHGPGSRPIFSWRAVKSYIEGTAPQSENDAIRLADGTVIDLDQATKQATRLLR